ncbi:MAG TPA: S8 family serine peptidase [Solirubrobacterales bacterium]
MTRAGLRARRRIAVALGAALAACALVPAGASALATAPGEEGLSARLAELATPGMRSAPHDLQARVLSLPAEGPGSLLRSGGRVFVEVRFDSGAPARVDAIRRLGITVAGLSRREQTVTVAARPGQLRALARVPGVEVVGEVLTPVTRATCPGGAITSEGDAQLLAAAARDDFGLDGTGVEVGILSDSFDLDSGAATDAGEDIASGDLPGPGNPCERTAPVDILSDPLSPVQASDEGRGMAQIVHDVAPGAQISFASAFQSESSFASNIRSLAAAGAGVIVDDVAWFEEPFFQDGPVAAAIADVVAGGSTYLTAAGNDNIFEGENEIASWEAPEFRDGGGCPSQLETATEGNATHCMDFNPGPGGSADDTFGITVEKDGELVVDLQWAEPWEAVDADLDAYLLDESGKPLQKGAAIVGSQEDNPGTTERPVEVFGWENETGEETEVQLAIDRCLGLCNPGASEAAVPRLKFILLENGAGDVLATEFPQSANEDVVGPAVYGHAGAPAAIAVGAVPYFDSGAAEAYSSRGPATHYFGEVLPAGGGPAPAIPPQTIEQPQVAATDCGRTTFFFPSAKTPGIFRFCGTSAAAPHAAGVVALARQANPTLTPATIAAGLRDTARPLPPAFGAAVGAGLVDAHEMIEETALPPKITITSPPKAVGRDPRPSIAFEANRPVTFRCEIDGSGPFPCASPFVPDEPLDDGDHGFVVTGIDLAGRIGVSPVLRFTIDTVAPRTFINGHPRKNLRIRGKRVKTVFRFRASEPNAIFTCRIDGGLFRFCAPRVVRRFGPGRHAVRVKAVDRAGNVDATPAVFRFKVKRVGR